MKALTGLYLLLAGLWCGSLTFFAAAAARIVLNTAPTRHDAGTVNRALLDALDLGTLAAVGLLLILLLVLHRWAPWPKLPRALTLRLLALAAVLAFVSRTLITPEMMAVRERMGAPIDLVPRTEPLRKDWGRLHALSSLALAVRILAAAGVFGLGFAAVSDAATRRARSLYVEPPPADSPPAGPPPSVQS